MRHTGSHFRLRLRAMFGVLAIGFCVVTQSVHGQFVQIDSTRIPAEEYQWQVEQLDPSPTQRDAIEIAYARYAQEYDEAKQVYDSLGRWIWSNSEGNDRWYGGLPREEFRETISREYESNSRRWEDAWREIEAQYFDRLATIAPGRDAAHESFKRRRLRFREFNDFSISGDRCWEVDLIDIVHRVAPEASDEPAVAEAMLEYEVGLHRVLTDLGEYRVERRQRQREFSQAIANANADGRDDSRIRAEMREWRVRGGELTYALRAMQQSSATRILAAITDEKTKMDIEEAFAVALWAVFLSERALTPETAFSEALERRDLSPAKRDQVQVLRDAYRDRRRGAIKAMEKPYLDQFSPKLYNEFWRLHDAGDRDAANAIFSEARSNWTELSEKWRADCEKTISELRGLLSEPSQESSP